MAVTINASTSTGLVQSADTSGEIELQSNGTTALKVNTNEGIQILNCLGVGNATPSTSGAGITFPATASPSSNANTLDDYEEGTFTPVITSQTGSLTAYTSAGSYTKVGRTVYINAKFSITTAGTAGGYATVGAYPFSPDSNFETQGVAREGQVTGDIYFSLLTSAGAGFIIGSSGNSGIAWVSGRTYNWNFSYNV